MGKQTMKTYIHDANYDNDDKHENGESYEPAEVNMMTHKNRGNAEKQKHYEHAENETMISKMRKMKLRRRIMHMTKMMKMSNTNMIRLKKHDEMMTIKKWTWTNTWK